MTSLTRINSIGPKNRPIFFAFIRKKFLNEKTNLLFF
jgi:hypothetical protein